MNYHRILQAIKASTNATDKPTFLKVKAFVDANSSWEANEVVSTSDHFRAMFQAAKAELVKPLTLD